MGRSKIVAVITGVIAVLLGVAYLLLVQALDFRGEMVPAPVDLSRLESAEQSRVDVQAFFLVESILRG